MFSIDPLDWQKEDGCLLASAINSWFEVSKKKDDTCFEWRWILDGEGECLCRGTASTLEEAAEIANKKWHDELCIYLTEEKRK